MSENIKRFGRSWTGNGFSKAIGGVVVGTVALASGIVRVRRGEKRTEHLSRLAEERVESDTRNRGVAASDLFR